MFSTIDSPGNRILRVELHTTAGTMNVSPPQALANNVSAALAAPSQDRLTELSVLIGRQRWVGPRVDADITALESEHETMRQLITEALVAVLPSAVIRSIEPKLFDPAVHQDVVVQEVVVSVYRLVADGPARLEPTLVRTVSTNVGSPPAAGRP